MDPPAFGPAMREEFRMSPTLTQLNQGSYGTVPKRIMQKLREAEDVHDGDFNSWFRNDRHEQIPPVKAKIAPYFGMKAQDFEFVENATRGLNNVMKRLPWSSGDAILYNNWTYGAVQNMIDDIVDSRSGAVSKIRIDHPYPIESEQQILQQYERALQENSNIKLAVLDHISSGPAVLFPVAAITALCHQYNVQVLIDGAHCPGHLALDIEAINADYYVGNLHKWFFSARGVGFQWVRPEHHNAMYPAVTSFDYDKPFPKNTFNQGTRNDAPYLVASDAVDFYEWVGGLTAIQDHCVPMLQAAVTDLAEAFGTRRLEVPSSMEPPLLLSVLLPNLPGFDMMNGTSISNYISDVYDIWASVVSMSDTVTVMRLSGSIFNEAADYDKVKVAVLEMMEGKVDKKALELAKKKAEICNYF